MSLPKTLTRKTKKIEIYVHSSSVWISDSWVDSDQQRSQPVIWETNHQVLLTWKPTKDQKPKGLLQIADRVCK